MKKVKFLGIDLAKTNFSVCALSQSGEVLYRKSLKRDELLQFMAQLPACTVGIEACGGSHYWGRVFERQGHQVKMMSVFSAKAFAPHQKKNDASDAQAIAVAASQHTVPSVRIKSTSSQDLDILKNLREQYVKHRVALINQAHALCLEYGVSLPKSKTIKSLEKYFEVIEESGNELTDIARSTVLELIDEAKSLNEKALQVEKKLSSLIESMDGFKFLNSVPGVGLMTAAAVLSQTGGKVDQFKNGRQFAAYLGLVPRQYSTGGRTTLRKITKAGNPELRRLLVIGTRCVMLRSEKKSDQISQWIVKKKQSKGFMRANIALANKTARIIYAVLKNQEMYKVA